MTLWNLYEKSEVFRQAEGGEMTIETASLFVCGMILREIFFPDLTFLSPQEEYSLEETWYMLCLHHDKRMERQRIWKKACVEKRRDRNTRRWESRNIDTNSKWRPMKLCFSPLFRYIGEGVRFTNGVCVTECRLSEAEVKDYFYFRNTCCSEGGMDHGIAGGLLLYENLIRRHLQQKGELSRKALNLYSYAANTMMVHNICGEYKEKMRITPENDPLLFLFVLAETIEPLQYRAIDINYRILLNAIRVEIFEREITLQMDLHFFHMSAVEERLKRLAEKVNIECEWERETSKICICM